MPQNVSAVADFLSECEEAFIQMSEVLRNSVSSDLQRFHCVFDPGPLNLQLKFAQEREQRTRFLFFRRSNLRPEFLLHLDARLERGDDPGFGQDELQVLFGLPDFIAQRGGVDHAELEFRAHSGEDYTIRFTGDSCALDPASGTHDAIFIDPDKPLDAQGWLKTADVVDTLASWVRQGAPAHALEYLRPYGDTQPEPLPTLYRVIDETKIVLSRMTARPPAYVSLTNLNARLDFYVNQAGRTIENLNQTYQEPKDLLDWSPTPLDTTKPFNSQKFSLALTLSKQGNHPTLTIRPLIPDILVDGEWHQRFGSYLNSSKLDRTIDQLARMTELGVQEQGLQWRSSVAAGRFVVIRTGLQAATHGGRDRNLVLLDLSGSGPTLRVALELDLRFSEEGTVQNDDIQHISALQNELTWRTANSDTRPSTQVPAWLNRLFRGLHSIQMLHQRPDASQSNDTQ